MSRLYRGGGSDLVSLYLRAGYGKVVEVNRRLGIGGFQLAAISSLWNAWKVCINFLPRYMSVGQSKVESCRCYILVILCSI